MRAAPAPDRSAPLNVDDSQAAWAADAATGEPSASRSSVDVAGETGAPSAAPRLAAPGSEPDYRLCVVLEPSGVVRNVVEVSGVQRWDPRTFVGQNIVEVSGGMARDEDAHAVWTERLERARAHGEQARYMDLRPDQPIGAEPTVSCTMTPVRSAAGTLESIVLQIEAHSNDFEHRLMESEQHFRVLAEALPQMVWVADATGAVTYFSPRWSEFTGRSTEDLVGVGYVDLMHPDDQAQLMATVAELDDEPTIQSYTFRLRRHDGEYRWMEAHVHTIMDASGQRAEAVGGTTDVTDIRAADHARLRMQKREAIGTLASGVAHDFNNVISAIISNAWVAEAELAAGDSPATSIEEIGRGARRAGDLVKRLLTYSREEEPRRVAFDLPEVVREACALVLPTLPADVTLHTTIADDLPLALGDSTQLHQVVMNLVSNAGYAIGARGGTIEVALGVQRCPGSNDGLGMSLPAGDILRLTVRDDGSGIADDIQQRVFDPFFTTKPSGEGTGLGLAAAQTIVRNHRGTLTLESIHGEGSTFTVALPAGPTSRPEPGPPEEIELSMPAAVSTNGPRVMFVDDETALTRLAPRALAASGCTAVVFNDPTLALEAFRETPDRFDALITDLSMPVLGGLDLIAAIRDVRPELPVILSSGFMTDEHRRVAEELRVDRVLPKPCALHELGAVVIALGVERATRNQR